jgi:charged multivesicular body protein 3
MDEMMQDTLEAMDEEDIEEEADAEVDKVLYDLTDGKLGQAGKVGTELPVSFVFGAGFGSSRMICVCL